jgi:hypothetical protein
MDQATLEKIRLLVEDQTRADGLDAEREWRAAVQSHGLAVFGATPALDFRPSSGGRELVIRYITKAQSRFATRIRLQQELLAILQPDMRTQSEKILR